MRLRLFGQEAARITQAARIEDVDAATARQRLLEGRLRPRAVRAAGRLYGLSIDDPDLYHLQIDSTVVTLDAYAALIAVAYRGRVAA